MEVIFPQPSQDIITWLADDVSLIKRHAKTVKSEIE